MFTDFSREKCKHVRRNTKSITNESQLFQIIIVVIRFYFKISFNFKLNKTVWANYSGIFLDSKYSGI